MARTWLSIAAAAAVVALATGLTVTPNRSPQHPARQAGHRASRPHPTIPAGYQWIAYHGITVAVPARLPVSTVPCGLPADYVLASDPERAYACSAERVRLQRTRLAVSLSTGSVGTPQGTSRRIGDVEITVIAPTRAQAQLILRSARVGPDPHGCPQTRPSSAINTGLGQPVRAVYCVYSAAAWLQASYQLPRPDRVAAEIDALPAGRPDSHPYERDLVRFTDRDGRIRDIQVVFGDPPAFTDGRTTRIDRGSSLAIRLSRH